MLNSRTVSSVLLAIVLAGNAPAQAPERSTTPNPQEGDFLEPVRPPTIKLNGFWKQQTKRFTEMWLPHCIRQMEKGGEGEELLNLVALGQMNRGEPASWKFKGLPWSDAYVYNTVEAICLGLAVEPDGDDELAKAQAGLRSKLEEWIAIILAAQAPDGYIHSFHALNGHPRYSNVGAHEFYVMGYFLEMGVAHYRMSGGSDRRLYEAARRCADHLCATFGPAPKRTWRNGHPGMEYALCRLGSLVNEVEGRGQGDPYIRLARHILEHQHEGPDATEYNQSDRPAVDLERARGHAVRATYFYTAMTDMALLQGDENYARAVDRIWENAIQKKHYLTGGVGASHKGEAFAEDFELPNTGYCESCASCGLSFWADRMHRLHKDGHYSDVQERVLYNNVLGSVDLKGETFYYQNPLASDQPRHSWHRCPCCVGNIPRTLFAIKDLIYSANPSKTELYVSHYVDSDATLPMIGGGALRVRQTTRYPWEGAVKLVLHPQRPARFTLKLRIPDRTESALYSATPDLEGRFSVRVNGKQESAKAQKGYIELSRQWTDGDSVELLLPMDIQRVYCDPRVKANRGRVALQRGPIVYSVEDVDLGQAAQPLVLKTNLALQAVWKPDLLQGIMALSGPGFFAVPNFARLNRGGSSQVWLVQNPAEVVNDPLPPAAPWPINKAVETRTVDSVKIGNASSEKEHLLQQEKGSSGTAFGRPWRHATDGGWFSYRLKVAPESPQSVLCAYWGDESGARRFTILVDGQQVGRQTLGRHKPGEFYAVEYPLPAGLLKNKSHVTVKIAAEPGATAGGVFDLRIVRAESGSRSMK